MDSQAHGVPSGPVQIEKGLVIPCGLVMMALIKCLGHSLMVEGVWNVDNCWSSVPYLQQDIESKKLLQTHSN